MRIKECTAQVKAAGDTAGQFTALVSVFGNKDSVGDVVMSGAFTDTLAEWAASGDPIPVIWSHDWLDPFSHIGVVTSADQTDAGLQVTGQLDMDNAKAQQVYRLLKAGRVKQFSFAYDVEEGAWVESTTDGVEESRYELRKLKLYEVGPTLVGANQETELLAVKAAALAAGLKEGRVLAQKHVDKIAAARDALSEVLDAAAKTSPSDDGKDAAQASAKQDASRPETAHDAAAALAAAERAKSGAAQAIARLQLAATTTI